MTVLAERHCVCEYCLRPVIGRLRATKNRVFLEKHCSRCNDRNGITRTLISSDPKYFLQSWIGGQQTLQPHGLSALIIEVTDDCNLRCPTCIAGSEPGAGNTRRFRTIDNMIQVAESSQRKPDILMISGGEPTIHPKIIEILGRACAGSISRIFLITNGKRIAEEPAFVEKLAALPNAVEIYLQFDSLEPEVLRDLRGEDLSEIRRKAIRSLCAKQISTTLVSVVKQGLNDHLCGDVVRYALSFPNIRGVTFQPIRASGRRENLTRRNQAIDLARVRNMLIESKLGFTGSDLVPHPMNPENICTGYFLRGASSYKAATQSVCSKDSPVMALGNCLFFLPKHDCPDIKYSSLFRVNIISFMDKYNFAQELLPYTPIGFVSARGLIIPLDTYYMFGRRERGRTVLAS